MNDPHIIKHRNRVAAENELRKQGKTLKDYPWPEDGPRLRPDLSTVWPKDPLREENLLQR